VVLDVGSGTGILSLLAAKAGAARVYSIEASEAMCALSRDIVAKNGCSDIVTVCNTKMEDWAPPADFEGADVIISEWMGYFLLYEGMLDSVLLARDLYLKPGGLMYPDKCQLFVFGYTDIDDDGLEFLDDLYGIDMSTIKPLVLLEPVVDFVDPRQLCTSATPVVVLDMNTCPHGSTGDISFEFKLTATDNGSEISGIGTYFDIGFTDAKPPVGFSTGPRAKKTHWKQTLFPLHKQAVSKNKGETVEGRFAVKENGRNRRDLDIDVEVEGIRYEFKLK
jgi:protein arginine N-methyltransferase 1